MRQVVLAIAVVLLAALLWVREMPAPRVATASLATTAAPPAPSKPHEPEPPMLKGVVFLPNGLRAPHAILQANFDPTPTFAFAEADGSFAIPVGPRAFSHGLALVVEHPRSRPSRNILAVPAEQVRAGDLEVVLTWMPVSGRAVDEDLRPIPYATIELLADTPPCLRYGSDAPELLLCPAPQADREGRFAFRLQPRKLRVVCRAPGRSPAVRFVAGSLDGAHLGDIVLAPTAPSR